MTPKQELMCAVDDIKVCGQIARDELEALCPDLVFWYKFDEAQIKASLEICRKIWKKWHTTEKFKVGDKVYVHPGHQSNDTFKNCIRATVTNITKDYGYELRAFQRDLPGVYMFNVWDKDLSPRTSKRNKKI